MTERSSVLFRDTKDVSFSESSLALYERQSAVGNSSVQSAELESQKPHVLRQRAHRNVVAWQLGGGSAVACAACGSSRLNSKHWLTVIVPRVKKQLSTNVVVRADGCHSQDTIATGVATLGTVALLAGKASTEPGEVSAENTVVNDEYIHSRY